MPVEVGHAVVPISADLAGFQRQMESGVENALSSTASKMQSKGRTMFRSGAIMTAGITAPVVAGFTSAISAASDLNETVSKARTIFGSAADDLEKWADTAAKSFGQSRQQALDAAGSFGNMFTQLGIGTDVALDMSTAMVELATDFASFHNADITEVLNAQQAAFRGEYDALQRFVPTINAAAVEQKALAITGKATTKELTLQEKAIAVQQLMLEGAGEAMGDFARTSDGAANKQRILRAQMADAAATLGQQLLPVATKLLGWVQQAIHWFSELDQPMQGIILAGAALLAVIGPLVAVVGALVTAVGFLISPVGLVIAGVAALTAGVIYAYRNWDWFRDTVDAVARFLRDTVWPAIQAGVDILTERVIPVIAKVIEWWIAFQLKVGQVAVFIGQKIGAIIGFFRDLADWFARNIDRILGPIDEILGAVGKVAGAVGGFLGDVGGGIGGVLGSLPGFDTGGVVPGPLGAPTIIRAHGGEMVVPTHNWRAMRDMLRDDVSGVVVHYEPKVIGEPDAFHRALMERDARRAVQDGLDGVARRLA